MITLRDIIPVLQKRLGVEPLKVYWRETKSEFTKMTDIHGVEIMFPYVSSSVVKATMRGIPLVERKKFKPGRRPYIYLLRFEMKSSSVKFRCTLYVYPNEKLHFIFTKDW
jgi:hypothetical protein